MKVRLRKVTIIAERVLRDKLIDLIREHGATGYTLTEVAGEGSRGIHAAEWEGTNLQMDVIVSNDIATALMAAIGSRYFEHFAVIVYSTEIEVLRGEKYVRLGQGLTES